MPCDLGPALLVSDGPSVIEHMVDSAHPDPRRGVCDCPPGDSSDTSCRPYSGRLVILVDTGKLQAARAGAEIVEGKVVELTRRGDQDFLLRTEDGKSVEAKQVILTLGANAELARTAGVATKEGTEPRIREIVDVDREGRTSVAGVWAAGTIAGVSVHTIITAGDGARVAVNLISSTRGERHVDHDVLPKPAEVAAG
jgi:thioredoxin reductase